MILNQTTGAYSYVKEILAIEVLDAGDVATDMFTVAVSDGDGDPETESFVITITGADDLAIVSGNVSGNINEGNEEEVGTISGTLIIKDVDESDTPSFLDLPSTIGDNSYGSFIVSSNTWTYTLDQSKLQTLDSGDKVYDSITLTATDGTTQQVVITITGTNDAPFPILSIDLETTKTELDNSILVKGVLTAGDIDEDDIPPTFVNTSNQEEYGTFDLIEEEWTYTLSNPDEWGIGMELKDTTTFTATDGTTETVNVRISWLEEKEITVIGPHSNQFPISYIHHQPDVSTLNFTFENSGLYNSHSLELVYITIEATAEDLPKSLFFGESEVFLDISGTTGKALVSTDVLITNEDGSYSVPMQLPSGMLPDEYVVNILLVVKGESIDTDTYIETLFASKEFFVYVPHSELIEAGYIDLPKESIYSTTEVISTDTLIKEKSGSIEEIVGFQISTQQANSIQHTQKPLPNAPSPEQEISDGKEIEIEGGPTLTEKGIMYENRHRNSRS